MATQTYCQAPCIQDRPPPPSKKNSHTLLTLFHAVFIGENKDNLKHEDDMKNEDNLKYQIGSLNIEGLFQQRISSTAMITLVSEDILQQILHSLMNYWQQYERIFSIL